MGGAGASIGGLYHVICDKFHGGSKDPRRKAGRFFEVYELTRFPRKWADLAIQMKACVDL